MIYWSKIANVNLINLIWHPNLKVTPIRISSRFLHQKTKRHRATEEPNYALETVSDSVSTYLPPPPKVIRGYVFAGVSM